MASIQERSNTWCVCAIETKVAEEPIGRAVSRPPALAMMAAVTHDSYTAAPYAAGLLARIEDRTAVVGVIGLGYVGLPLALVFVEAGFLASSPEREGTGNLEFSTRTIPKLAVGVDTESTLVATALHAAAGCRDDADEVPTLSPRRRYPA